MIKNAPGKISYTRIIELDLLLRKDMVPALEDLAKRFDVSKRTIERDIETLRTGFGAPVQYDRKRKVYGYADKSYVLPPLPLSEEELVSVLITERSLRQYSGTPFEVVARQAFEKLLSMIPAKTHISVDPFNLCKAIVFEQGAPIREVPVELSALILNAIIRKQRLEIEYLTTQGNKEEATRFIDPYHLANWGNEWFLLAKDLRSSEIRALYLSRMKSANAIDLFFERPVDFAPQEHIAKEMNRRIQRAEEQYRIKVFASSSAWVRDMIWQYTQKFEKIEEGESMIFYSNVPEDVAGKESLKRWLFQFGDEIEVLGPPWLRKEIRGKLERAKAKYEKSPVKTETRPG